MKRKKEKIRKILDEIYEEYKFYLDENFGEEILLELTGIFTAFGYEITKESVIAQMLWCYMCKMQ